MKTKKNVCGLYHSKWRVFFCYFVGPYEFLIGCKIYNSNELLFQGNVTTSLPCIVLKTIIIVKGQEKAQNGEEYDNVACKDKSTRCPSNLE